MIRDSSMPSRLAQVWEWMLQKIATGFSWTPKWKSAENLYNSGRTYYDKNDLVKAEDFFRKALVLDFSYSKALKGLGFTLHRLGKIDEAIYFYLRYLDAQPDDVDVHANLIAALEAVGKYDEAIVAGERAVERFPSNAALVFMLARNNYFAGRIETAIWRLKKAIELDPENAEIYRILGVALKTRGDLTGALANFQEAIKHNPSDGDAHLAAADAYQRLGRDTEYLQAARAARQLYEEAKNDPGLKFACWDEAWALYKLRRWDESVAASECALKIDPSLSPARFNLGLALLRLGQTERAKQEYQNAVEHADAASLKVDAIDDLVAAIREQPDLPGASEILQELESRYQAAATQRADKLAEHAPAN
jgi:tetratricopeptide (TPR) repeat protein